MESAPANLAQAIKTFTDAGLDESFHDEAFHVILSFFTPGPKNHLLLTIPDLLEILESYLVSPDDKQRARATTLLGDILGSSEYFPHNTIDASILHLLVVFFCRRLADYPSILPALQALKVLTSSSYQPVIDDKYLDKLEIFKSIFQEIFLQSYAQNIRFKVLDLFLQILQMPMSEYVFSSNVEILEGITTSIENEKDPRCLVQGLRVLTSCLTKIFPYDTPNHSQCIQRAFNTMIVYFPITFTPPENDSFGITQDLILSVYLEFLTCHRQISAISMMYFINQVSSCDEDEGKGQAMDGLAMVVSKGYFDYSKLSILLDTIVESNNELPISQHNKLANLLVVISKDVSLLGMKEGAYTIWYHSIEPWVNRIISSAALRQRMYEFIIAIARGLNIYLLSRLFLIMLPTLLDELSALVDNMAHGNETHEHVHGEHGCSDSCSIRPTSLDIIDKLLACIPSDIQILSSSHPLNDSGAKSILASLSNLLALNQNGSNTATLSKDREAVYISAVRCLANLLVHWPIKNLSDDSMTDSAIRSSARQLTYLSIFGHKALLSSPPSITNDLINTEAEVALKQILTVEEKSQSTNRIVQDVALPTLSDLASSSNPHETRTRSIDVLSGLLHCAQSEHIIDSILPLLVEYSTARLSISPNESIDLSLHALQGIISLFQNSDSTTESSRLVLNMKYNRLVNSAHISTILSHVRYLETAFQSHGDKPLLGRYVSSVGALLRAVVGWDPLKGTSIVTKYSAMLVAGASGKGSLELCIAQYLALSLYNSLDKDVDIMDDGREGEDTLKFALECSTSAITLINELKTDEFEDLSGKLISVLSSKINGDDKRLAEIVSRLQSSSYIETYPRGAAMTLLWVAKSIYMRRNSVHHSNLTAHIHSHLTAPSSSIYQQTLAANLSIIVKQHPYILAPLPSYVESQTIYRHVHYSPLWKQILWLKMFQSLSPVIQSNVSTESGWALLALCSLTTSTPMSIIEASGNLPHLLTIVVRTFHISSSSDASNPLLSELQAQSLVAIEALMSHSIEMFAQDFSSLAPLLLKVAQRSPHGRSRLLALRCFEHATGLPYRILYPMRKEAIKSLGKSADDKKRAVRMLAAKIRNLWIVLDK